MVAETIIQFNTGHTGQIHHTALDYYGKRLATAGADGNIKIFKTGVDPQGEGFYSGLNHEFVKGGLRKNTNKAR